MALAVVLLLGFAPAAAEAAVACDGRWYVQPGVPPELSEARDLVVMGDGDVYAVGQSHRIEGGGPGQVAHYTDGRWTVQDVPGTTELIAVAGRVGEVWAVGHNDFTPVVAKLVAGTWQVVLTAPEAGRLLSVAVTSGRNVWVAGYLQGPRGGRGLAWHFDGVRWQRYLFGEGVVDAVGTTGPDDARLLGYSAGDAVAWHWNGRSWRREVVVQQTGNREASFSAIRTRPGGSTWAVGMASDDFIPHAIVARHTAQGWRTLSMPERLITSPAQDLLVDDRRGLVTVVGAGLEGDGEVGLSMFPVFETYDGARWRSVHVAGLPASAGRLLGWSRLDGDGHGGAWALGFATGGPVLAHRCR